MKSLDMYEWGLRNFSSVQLWGHISKTNVQEKTLTVCTAASHISRTNSHGFGQFCEMIKILQRTFYTGFKAPIVCLDSYLLKFIYWKYHFVPPISKFHKNITLISGGCWGDSYFDEFPQLAHLLFANFRTVFVLLSLRNFLFCFESFPFDNFEQNKKLALSHLKTSFSENSKARAISFRLFLLQ